MKAIDRTIAFLTEFRDVLSVGRIDVAACQNVGTANQEIHPRRTPLDLNDAESTLATLRWLNGENRTNGQVWFRPAHHESWSVAYLDDVPKTKALRICERYKAVAVETSPGNCQVWIATSMALTRDERRTVQEALIKLLHANRIHADQHSKDGMHYGRLPGYQNRKPGAANWTNTIAWPNPEHPALDPRPHLSPSLPPKGAGVSLALAAPGGSRHRTHSDLSGRDESAAEFSFAIKSLQAGVPDHETEGKIAQHAYARGKRTTYEKALRYAQMTVRNARKHLGH
jgi:hypothetical protein